MNNDNLLNQTPHDPNAGSNEVVTSDGYRYSGVHKYAKVLVAIAFVIVVGGLATYVQIHHSNQPNTSNSPIAVSGDEIPFKTSATVDFQNQQVMPASITVPTQTDISFENLDSVDYHIDSAQTTGNTTIDLPFNGKVYSYFETAFANNVLVSAKGGYNYVFTTPGTYYYHEVNNANMNGEIIVN
jgi:plastocyanin